MISALAAGLALSALPVFPSTAAADPPLPLGTVTEAAPPTDCPAGSVCRGLSVAVPGLSEAAIAYLSIFEPTVTARGVVVMFSGGGGNNWYLEGETSQRLGADLMSDGFRLVQVAWPDNWNTASIGELAGVAKVAGRPATVIDWVHDNYYLPLGVTPSHVGECGFCITGNSGGASIVAYAISFYGLDGMLDAIVPTGGPPHSDIVKGCLQIDDFGYAISNARQVDLTYGFGGKNDGACELRNGSTVWTDRWTADSLALAPSAKVFPATRVEVLVGADDTTGAIPHSVAYYNSLVAAGSPYVSHQTMQGVGHGVTKSEQGVVAIRAALLDYGPPKEPPGGEDDTEAPTAPTGLTGTIVSDSQVDLTWAPSSDNVGVTGYDIIRGRAVIAENVVGTSYQDVGLVDKGKTKRRYSYTVRARDAAGNLSESSNTSKVIYR